MQGSSWVLTATGGARSDFLGVIHVCHERLCRHDRYILEILLGQSDDEDARVIGTDNVTDQKRGAGKPQGGWFVSEAIKSPCVMHAATDASS